MVLLRLFQGLLIGILQQLFYRRARFSSLDNSIDKRNKNIALADLYAKLLGRPFRKIIRKLGDIGYSADNPINLIV